MNSPLAEPAEPFGAAAPAPEVTPVATEGAMFEAENISLRSLVHHSEAVEHDTCLEDVQRMFAARRVDFFAIVRRGLVSGVCSRLQLGFLLGSRYGFALYGRGAASLAQVAHPQIISIATPVREVLNRALGRAGDTFHEDVALVEEDGTFIGLIPIDALARLQTQLVADQVARLEAQQTRLILAHENCGGRRNKNSLICSSAASPTN